MTWKHAGRIVACRRCGGQMEQMAPAHKYCKPCASTRLKESRSAAAATWNQKQQGADVTDLTTEQRREILSRPCQLCGTKRSKIVAAHRYSPSKGGQHTLDNMEALCRSCQITRIRSPRMTEEEAKAYLATLPGPGKLYF